MNDDLAIHYIIIGLRNIAMNEFRSNCERLIHLIYLKILKRINFVYIYEVHGYPFTYMF